MNTLQIGIMGPGMSATEKDMQIAFELGYALGEKNHILISGGMISGTMGEACRGYNEVGGTHCLAITSSKGERISKHANIVIPTRMGSGRNYLNILASNIIFAIGNLESAGTCSEVMLKLAETKKDKKVNVIIIGEGTMVDVIRQVHTTQVRVAKDVKEALIILGSII